MNLLVLRFLTVSTLGLFSMLASGDELMKPNGPVILTVMGNLQYANTSVGTAEFDVEMLEAIGLKETVTATPWTDGISSFEGVFIKDLLKTVGATNGSVLKITALNDYSSNMPIEDLNKYNVLLAMKENGKMLRIRDKGPLFVIYPFDEFPELQNEIIHNRSVWQVKTIKVE